VSSTLGTTLISIVAAWSVALFVPPVVSISDTPSATQSSPYKPSPRNLFRLSPIPPGADWTA
jgi:hypothetical protein